MLKTLKESLESNISHQALRRIRALSKNILYPPFIYSPLAKKLILILGCQRSGNTLTFLMLNCHNSIQGTDESDSNYRLPNFFTCILKVKKAVLLL